MFCRSHGGDETDNVEDKDHDYTDDGENQRDDRQYVHDGDTRDRAGVLGGVAALREHDEESDR